MKKINVKKLVASIAALSAVACMAAIPASAVDTPATYGESKKACAVAIGQATVTVDELKASNYQVPVIIKVTPNPKISILEFGVSSELPYKFLTTDDFTVDDDNNPTGKFAELKALKTAPAGLSLSIDMASNIVEDNGKNVAWLTWAAEKGKTTANFAVMVVDVPKDVKGGEEFDLTYLKEGLSGNPELCANNEDGTETDYVKDGNFEGISGWIHVVGSETTTTTATQTQS